MDAVKELSVEPTKASFGNCVKHLNFPMVNCPSCEVEKIIKETNLRIDAGEVVLKASKKQMSILKRKLKAAERIKEGIDYR